MTEIHETHSQGPQRECTVSRTHSRFTERLRRLGVKATSNVGLFEETDRVAVHDSGLGGRKGRLLQARHETAILHVFDDLQDPGVAAEEAAVRALEASALSPALHEATQLGHPGVDGSVTVQQLGVVDRQQLVELRAGGGDQSRGHCYSATEICGGRAEGQVQEQ